MYFNLEKRLSTAAVFTGEVNIICNSIVQLG